MNQISDSNMSTELENSFEEEIDLRDELSKLSIHLRLVKEEGGGRIYPQPPFNRRHCIYLYH